MIYLDYAATSWPKPKVVLRAMHDFLEEAGGNPGRSGHRLSIAAGRIVYETREQVAELFNVPDPLRVVFAANVTHALNTAILALVAPGDRVVTTGIEHNSVMRPLRNLEQQGLELVVVPNHADGSTDLEAWEAAMLPGTKLAVINHASNVVGIIQPVLQMAEAAHMAGALVLLDAAQTAGILPLNMPALGVDLLAFTGHKGLQGPPGTGGLVIGATVDEASMRVVFAGGTGSRSEQELQPEMLPDKFEFGTCNGSGIAGLGAGLGAVLEQGIDAIRAHEVNLTRRLIEGLRMIKDVTVHGPGDAERQTATVSITVDGRSVSEIGMRLDEEYDILCRVGLHCSPACHRTIGTFPDGTVRLAPGLCTKLADIDVTLKAIEALVRS